MKEVTPYAPLGKCFNRLGVKVRCMFLGVKVRVRVKVSVMNSGVTIILSGRNALEATLNGVPLTCAFFKMATTSALKKSGCIISSQFTHLWNDVPTV